MNTNSHKRFIAILITVEIISAAAKGISEKPKRLINNAITSVLQFHLIIKKPYTSALNVNLSLIFQIK